MHGRILIADDRFASRLMLSALFGGAYYDVLQCDTEDGAMAVMRRERPGMIVISDGLSGTGAAGLCERLRRDPETADAARIVMTDLSDPERTAMLIHAGADEVIPRSCRDEEVLARVRTLVDHRARIAALNLRDDAPRPQPGLGEAAASYQGATRIALVADPGAAAEHWMSALRATMGQSPPPQITLMPAAEVPLSGRDILLVDAGTLGRDRSLRLVASVARSGQPREMQILLACGADDRDLAIKALDLGADGVLSLPFEAREAAARITLLLRRKQEITRLHTQLRSGLRSAMTDPLTGLYNRRYALPRLDQVMRDVRVQQQPAAVIMADLDHFKCINDTYGHPAGDAVLQAVARAMKSEAGPPGFAARMGGEEFLVALPACTRLEAAAAARRIRAAVADLRVPCPAVPEGLRVTISVGVAVAEPTRAAPGFGPSEDTAALLAHADRALYRAKGGGRNRVVVDLDLVRETVGTQGLRA
jgi:two-component system cell cycle response regulator